MDTTGTEQASKAIDTTTIAKRRDLPPLNVYVRIRPFIGDELERGENQKLLDILNEKHIAIKILPTVSNTIRNVQASYNEYEVLLRIHPSSIPADPFFSSRSHESLMLVVLNKICSSKSSSSQPMRYSPGPIGFSARSVLPTAVRCAFETH